MRALYSVATGICIYLVSVSVLAAPPVAVNDVRSIPAETVATFNILANDFDPDGDSLTLVAVDASENASVTINNDGSIRYVPNDGFSGTDNFTYTIQESADEALTATAVVSVVVLRRDLEEVADAIVAQANIANVVDNVCTRLRALSDAELGALRRNLLERCNALNEISANNPEAVAGILRQISPDEFIAVVRVAQRFGRSHSFAVSQRLDQRRAGVQGFTFNGLPAKEYGQAHGGAAGANDLVKPFGMFASVQYTDSEQDTTATEVGYDADNNSFTVGLDYRLGAQWVVGAAVGVSSGELTFADEGGLLESDQTTFLAFASFNSGNFSFDSQLGYAQSDFDTARTISYAEPGGNVNDTLVGQTDGDQIIFNNVIQWQWNRGAYTALPFARLDYAGTTVSRFSERGMGGLAMRISEQANEQLTLGLGLQNTYAMSFDWGVWVPSFELVLNSEASGGYDPVEAGFAFDPDTSATFVVENNGGDSGFWQVALASAFTFKGGTSAFLQYQQVLGYENLSSYSVSGGLRYEF